MSKKFNEWSHLLKHLIILAIVCVIFLGPLVFVTAKDKVMKSLPTFNCDEAYRIGFKSGVRTVAAQFTSECYLDETLGLGSNYNDDRFCHFRMQDGVEGRIEYPKFMRKEKEDDVLTRSSDDHFE